MSLTALCDICDLCDLCHLTMYLKGSMQAQTTPYHCPKVPLVAPAEVTRG